MLPFGPKNGRSRRCAMCAHVLEWKAGTADAATVAPLGHDEWVHALVGPHPRLARWGISRGER
jgi:hypothetical protein